MKKTFATIAKLAAVIVTVAATALVASAWTAPTSTAPGGNVPAPVNTGTVDQSKDANLGVTKSFFAGDSIAANNLIQGFKAAFGCPRTPDSVAWACFFANQGTGNTDILRAFKYNVANGIPVPGGNGFRIDANGFVSVIKNYLTVDLVGTGGNGTDAIQLIGDTNGSHLNNPVAIISNKAALTFWNTPGNKRMSLNALNADLDGTVRIGGGSPAEGKVLVATDANGNAVWGGADEEQTLLDAGDVKVIRFTWDNSDNSNGYTRIHNAYAFCDAGYMAVSGGVDCESQGGTFSQFPLSTLGVDRIVHAVQVSEPAIAPNVPYPYGTGSGSGIPTSGYPTAWHGMCGNGQSGTNQSDKDMHITVTCVKVNTLSLLSADTTPAGGNTGGIGGNTGGNNGSNSVTWSTPNVGSGPDTNGYHGNLGYSCNQWLTGGGAIFNNTRSSGTYTTGGSVNTLSPLTGTCAYKHTNPVSKDAGITINGITTLYSRCQIHSGTYTSTTAFPVSTCTDTSASINGSSGSITITTQKTP